MAFDLKRVLKVMLFASNGPLAVKDIQTAITRFHEQETALPMDLTEEGEPKTDAADPLSESAPATGSAPTEAGGGDAPVETPTLPAPEAAEEIVPAEEEDEIYREVPSLVTTTQIREAMEQIAADLRAVESELAVIEGASGWRLVTLPKYARWVRLLRNEPPPVRLSGSALETLSVVAYRQPVTRGEIEQIRGVSADAGINKLLERDLVYVVGRADLPGRPIQYGTTDAFLEFIGIKSLDELPASDVLSPRQIDAWLKTSEAAPHTGDSEMGLDETEEEQMSLESAAAKTDAVEPAPTAEEPSAPAAS